MEKLTLLTEPKKHNGVVNLPTKREEFIMRSYQPKHTAYVIALKFSDERILIHYEEKEDYLVEEIFLGFCTMLIHASVDLWHYGKLIKRYTREV